MRLKQTKYSLIAFILSVGTLLGIFYTMRIIPFGDNTMLVWDMKNQYCAFMSYLCDVLHGQASFPFSLQGGLGGNMYGLFAYYLSSPLNILLFFFSRETIPYAVVLLLLLKTGLASVTMQVYLYNKRQDAYSILFGCFYALSSFSVCYQFNIMWMDCFYLLPLIIEGIDNLIEKRAVKRYVVFLTLALISNYYIGFMICIFCVIYFAATFTYKYGLNDLKNNSSRFLDFAAGSLLSGGLSAFLVLPGMLVLRHSSSERVVSIRELFELSATFDVTHISRYVWAGGFDEEQGIQGIYPLIYCGSVVVFLVIYSFLFLNNSIRRIIYHVFILVTLFISMVCTGPYLLWHGVSDPSGCYWRFAFIWVFVCITIAYTALPFLKPDNYKKILISLLVIAVDMFFLARKTGFRISYILNFFLIIMFIVCYVVHKSSSGRGMRYFSIILGLVLCVGELFYNGVRIHKFEFSDLYMNYPEYIRHSNTIDEIADVVPIRDDNRRNAILGGFGDEHNLCYMHNVNAVNMYASTENQNAWEIYEELGLGSPLYESDMEYDAGATLLATAVLGIDYVIDWDWTEYNWFEYVDTVNDCNIYKSDYSLPLGFMVNESALDISWDEKRLLYDNLNDIYHSLLGCKADSPYKVIEKDTEGYKRFSENELRKYPRVFRLKDNVYTDLKNIATEDRNLINDAVIETSQYTKAVEIAGSKIKGVFHNPYDYINYACISVPYEKCFSVYVDGNKSEAVSGMGGMLLVPIEHGEHEVVLRYHVPGFMAGMMISILSGIIFFLMYFRKKVSYEDS